MDESTRQMYEYAVKEKLATPCCGLAYPEYKNIGWTVYIGVEDWSLMQYNKKHGTKHKSKYDKAVYNKIKLEVYSDEPRIGGYPTTVIRSYKEMLAFMRTGYTDRYKSGGKWKEKHYDFYYDKKRRSTFMKGIKTFFERHPDGIITFG